MPDMQKRAYGTVFEIKYSSKCGQVPITSDKESTSDLFCKRGSKTQTHVIFEMEATETARSKKTGNLVKIIVTQPVPFQIGNNSSSKERKETISKCLIYIESVLKTEKCVDLVVFPEFFLDVNLTMKSEFNDTENVLKRVGQVVRRSGGCYCVFGSLSETDEHGVYNTSFVFNRRGKVIFKHRKRKDEDFDSGSDDGVFTTDFGTCAILICLEVEHNELISASLRHKRVGKPFFFINPAWIPSGVKVNANMNKIARRSVDERFSKLCCDNDVYFIRSDVSTNSSAYSEHGEREFGCGTSLLLSNFHTVYAPTMQECCLSVVVDTGQNLQLVMAYRKPYIHRSRERDNVGIRYVVSTPPEPGEEKEPDSKRFSQRVKLENIDLAFSCVRREAELVEGDSGKRGVLVLEELSSGKILHEFLEIRDAKCVCISEKSKGCIEVIDSDVLKIIAFEKDRTKGDLEKMLKIR